MLGPRGLAVFGRLGIDADAVPRRTRPLLRPCLDWTERRTTSPAASGRRSRAEFARRDWVRRADGSRIVSVTPAGYAGLDEWLGLDLGRLRVAAAA